MSDFFDLPEMVLDLVNARDRLAAYYRDSGRTFTFDGKLVGDLGEALGVVGILSYIQECRTPRGRSGGWPHRVRWRRSRTRG
jgi:hypothetical protein